MPKWHRPPLYRVRFAAIAAADATGADLDAAAQITLNGKNWLSWRNYEHRDGEASLGPCCACYQYGGRWAAL